MNEQAQKDFISALDAELKDAKNHLANNRSTEDMYQATGEVWALLKLQAKINGSTVKFYEIYK
jgi:hypothetical protein